MFFRREKLQGKHVLITGGSKGLGLCLAQEFVQRGCDVTILARNAKDLKAAAAALTALANTVTPAPPKIQSFSADVVSSDQLVKAFADAEAGAGPIDIVVCNAGLSTPGVFAEQPIEDFQRTMEVNYMGTVRTVKAALPRMLARKQGHIVFITSVLAVCGFAGYSAYAGSKWAVRGLADCLHNELQGTGVKVSVAYPPDMDTPGYVAENETKPELCLKVEDSLGSKLFTPDRVAAKLVRQLEQGEHHLTTPDLGSNVLISGMTSLSPKSIPTLFSCLVQPIVQLVGTVVGYLADRTARKYNEQHGYPNSSGSSRAET